MPQSIPKGLNREHVLKALADLDAGIDHPFGQPTGYGLVQRQRVAEAALPHDLSASTRIAEWAYEQTERANGQVWVAQKEFRHLGPGWRRLLVA